MNKNTYDLTPLPQKDIFTYTDMTENDFEDLVVKLFDDHAKEVGDHWVNEVALDQNAVHDFARDLRAVLAAANGPLQATTSKPLPVIPWSGSNLTEMEELLQKTQQLETENAALRERAERYRLVTLRQDADNTALCNKLASLENQSQWKCTCGGTDCEGQKENVALRGDKEILDWMNNNIEAIMFKYKPDGFVWDVREIMRGAMSKETKP